MCFKGNIHFCAYGKRLRFSVFLQDFFDQLDHRMLSVFLKSCDELTDILPQEEQRGLQDTIHRLHKLWKVRGLTRLNTLTNYV